MNHIKRLRGHYLALLILITILAFPIYWIHHFFQNFLGREAALFSLIITVIIIVIFGVKGAVYTHKIISILREEVNKSNDQIHPERTKIPFVLKLFRIDRCHSQDPLSDVRKNSEYDSIPPHHFLLGPTKRRGKQPRFSEEKIRKAVLRWESRDPSFSARTLDEFLAQEFGSGPDGILLMATTTFYDWRRRILKELGAHGHKP